MRCIARYGALSEALSREHFGDFYGVGAKSGMSLALKPLAISSAFDSRLDAFSRRRLYCKELGSGTSTSKSVDSVSYEMGSDDMECGQREHGTSNES